MANYKPDYSHQNQFIAVDFSAQILPGTFEFALSHIVDNHLDLTAFDNIYKNDKGGAAAYSPVVMLKIILFAYSRGYISSRRIEQACQINITFMALSGDAQLHFYCQLCRQYE
ncbi:transposase [Catenovulum maritimum]|uniref:Transposase n=1 Tax=Catenovulum maritimum TaxID=1513271 RepID=A0A0J8GUG8_9ALTE|nr:transposase [Catenovulum maritimum]KMT64949.1 transposase [Catenovulum maritimum]